MRKETKQYLKKYFVLFMMTALLLTNGLVSVYADDNDEVMKADFAKWVQENEIGRHLHFSADDVKIVADFGTYQNGRVVLLLGEDWMMRADLETLDIGPYSFLFGSSSITDYFLLYHDHTFTKVGDAYDSGLLSGDELDRLAAVCGATENDEAMKADFAKWVQENEKGRHLQFTADDVKIVADYGMYQNGRVVVLFGEDWMMRDDIAALKIGSHTFLFGSSSLTDYFLLYHDRTFTEVREAYDNGLLSDDELNRLAVINKANWPDDQDDHRVNTLFEDVPKTAYCYDAVQWAVNIGITNGTSNYTFTPDEACTRAQAVTFLCRANGSEIAADANNPFADVKESDFYYNAVLWAVKNGITSGMTETTFGPDEKCTRGQIVTFLWRAEGQPEADKVVAFEDVQDTSYCYKAVQWAAEKGITKGTSETAFSPDAFCTRGQIVTFLHRAMAGL